MNSIWNKNLAAFLNRFPALGKMYQTQIEQISQFSSNSESLIWKLSTAKNGSVTGEEGNIRLHSAYNPEREAQQAILKVLETNKSSIIFFGFGLGYHIVEVAKSAAAKNLKIVLIEPDPLHFFEALRILDWSEVFSIPQLVLAIGCPLETIIPLIENQDHINIGSEGVSAAYCFIQPAFIAHAQSYFDSVKTLINRNKTKNEINAATYDKFANLWIKNSLKNLSYLYNCGKISDLANSKPAKTAILVAAGPSLENLLPYLKELQKNSLIVCVETALRACLRYDVQPDFVVITDPQYWAYRHIAGLHSPESILVCPLSVYPSVFNFDCKEILLCSDMFPVSQFYEKKLGTFGDLGAGGSVASSAWNLCYLLGVENIYLAGLDLSFPTKQTHIKGSSAEQTFHTISNKIRTAEKSTCGSMYSAIAEYGENYAGKKVLTDSRMKMFAWWFESRIDACKDIKTFSLSKDSLKIPGVAVADIQNLIKEKNSNSCKETINREKLGLTKTVIQNKEKLDSCKMEFGSELKNLQNLLNKAIEKCIINSPELKAELLDIDLQIKKNQLYEIIRLAQPSEKYMEEHKSEPKELAIYQKLQKAVALYKYQ